MQLTKNNSDYDDVDIREKSDDNVQSNNDIDSNEVNGATGLEERSYSQAKADAVKMCHEQMEDETLKGCWSLAKRGKSGFIIKNNLLYHTEKILGQSFTQLCLPKCRRAQVLELAHDTLGDILVKNVHVNAYVCRSHGPL